MKAPKVYYSDLHADYGNGLALKLSCLIREAGIGKIDMENRFVAIKLHFGELGNLAYLRPPYVRAVADTVRELGGIPFATDCSTLYVGNRKNGVDHLETAELNGFNSVSCGCPVITGDGIKGTDDVELPVGNGKHCETAKIGRAIADADVLITLTHFKGHELTSFGGSVKNISMGCASRRGKMELHDSEKPTVDGGKCRGCGTCIDHCGQGAIIMAGEGAAIDQGRCVGCGRCIGNCGFDAITVKFEAAPAVVVEKMVEYAEAVCASKPCFHISIAADVSPSCDCGDMNDLPIIPNVGMFASLDPVALDKAVLDMCNAQPILPGSMAEGNGRRRMSGSVFEAAHPETDSSTEFAHARRIGFGSVEYELVKVK